MALPKQLLLLVFLASANCKLVANADPFLCGPQGSCPNGLECVNERCELSEPFDGGNSAADSGVVDAFIPTSIDAAPVHDACGSTNELRDEFFDLNVNRWSLHDDSTVAGSALRMLVPSGKIGSSSAQTVQYYTFDGSQIAVEVDDISELEPGESMEFRVLRDPHNYAAIAIEESAGEKVIRFYLARGGIRTMLGESSFNAAAHRFWRLQAQGGVEEFDPTIVEYATSGNGVDWKIETTAESDVAGSNVAIGFVATGNAAGSKVELAVDSINSKLPVITGNCP